MSQPLEIKWNKKGLSDLLHSPEVVDWVDDVSSELVDDANSQLTGNDNGYKYSAVHGKKRYRANVYAGSTYAIRHNAKHNTLLKMLMDRGE